MYKLLLCIWAIALSVSLALTGCASLGSVLTQVDTALSDSDQILKLIETTFDAYQTLHPVSPADRAQYDQLLAAAYQTLNTGTRIVADAKGLNQGQYDQAFADFKTAYAALTTYLKAHGVTPVGSGLVGVGTASSDFPTPRVIGLKLAS